MINLRHRHQNIGMLISCKSTCLESCENKCELTTSEINITDTLVRAIDLGLYACSFSFGKNRNYLDKRIDQTDLNMALGIISRFPTIVFSIIEKYNLCGTLHSLGWNGNSEVDKKLNRVLEEIGYELEILSKMGGSSIIELGSYIDKSMGLNATAKSLNSIPFKMGFKLLLQNSLDKDYNVGLSLEDLYSVYNKLDSLTKSHVYLALDLSYLYANGLYDFNKKDELKRLFTELETKFPTFVLPLIILSDTNTNFGSKKINSVPIGTGSMWNSEDTLEELLYECKKRYTTIITKNRKDLEILRSLIDDFTL